MNFLGLTTPLLIDGGMATSLEAKGVPMHPTLWSGGAVIDDPRRVTEIHADFLKAGADLIITASYQLSPQALRALGYGRAEVRELLLRTVECAENACPGCADKLIAAGIGPYGAYLCDGSEYRGQYAIDRDALREFHRERFEILCSSKCDLIVFETIPCLDEVHAVAELCRDATKPVWVSMCCRNERELSSGEQLADAVKILDAAPSVVAVGVNCVAPRYVATHLKILKDATSKRAFVYPNLGQVWEPAQRVWQGQVDETSFLSLVDEWVALGADGIGGCCGVGSSLIGKIGTRLVRASARN
jgi:homocysteine S-methyltransferase